MNSLARELIRRESWSGLMMGNHAVARAMLETGVSVITSYPGSPVPEIGQALESIPAGERSFYYENSTNEKVASEIAFGASINGHLTAVFFKSVGLNVAADAIIQMAMLNLVGGMVIVLGDDPGAHSSQNEQDNRHMARMMYIPMFEPATPGEAYAMFKEAAELSKKYGIPVFLRLTTHVCHAHEVVSFGDLPEGKEDFVSRFDPDNESYFPLVSESMRLKKRLSGKLKSIEKESFFFKSNKIYQSGGNVKTGTPGIITAGMPALAIREIMLGEERNPDMLKLGMSFPLPETLVVNFLMVHDEVLIIEELDRTLEREIKTLAWDNALTCRIISKPEHFLQGEIGLHEAREILNHAWPDLFAPPGNVDTDVYNLAPRTARFCPGCGHRSAFFAVKQALPDEDTTFTVAGIGCHLMGHFDPYNMGRVLLCMGHSPSTATGLSLFNNKRKVVSFIGDSTFFHSGMPAIANAAAYNHNITVIIMDNFITAMTGHQANAGSGALATVEGGKAKKIPIFQLLESMGVGFLKTVDAYNQDAIKALVKESLDYKGFSVIIIKHPCMLKFERDKKQRLSGGVPGQIVRIDGAEKLSTNGG